MLKAPGVSAVVPRDCLRAFPPPRRRRPTDEIREQRVDGERLVLVKADDADAHKERSLVQGIERWHRIFQSEGRVAPKPARSASRGALQSQDDRPQASGVATATGRQSVGRGELRCSAESRRAANELQWMLLRPFDALLHCGQQRGDLL